jgi:hypothetical protein
MYTSEGHLSQRIKLAIGVVRIATLEGTPIEDGKLMYVNSLSFFFLTHSLN